MTTPTAHAIRPLSLVILTIFAILPLSRDAAADPFALSKVTLGGGSLADGGPFDLITEAELTAGAGHLASAYTDQLTRLSNQGLSAGARAGTSGEEQSARAEAEIVDAWDCVNCAFAGNFAPMSARISFDGILDPLIASLVAGVEGTDQSSLSAFFEYAFPYGTFSFVACYEPGNAFDRAESGCGNPLQATLDRSDGTHVDMTSSLVLGVNALGQTTVEFNEVLPWLVIMGRPWDDTMNFVMDVRSNDSDVPHLLDFFNTVNIQQTSLDPDAVFTSALGRNSAGEANTVPEPAALGLLSAGLAAVAAVSRRRRQAPPVSSR